MFLSFLIDPVDRTVRKVQDGFDRSATLIGTDDIEVTGLWESLVDVDSSVVLVSAPDAADDTDRMFRIRLSFQGHKTDKVAFGKAVLVACGDVPMEIAAQVSSVETVTSAIEFGKSTSTDMADWLVKRVVRSTQRAGRRGNSNFGGQYGRRNGSGARS